ncbi:hypothetical protein HZS_3971 [Henneguya salminicola]|nr:hypothetical protein HZS_3971 [Henneguya salminicola]
MDVESLFLLSTFILLWITLFGNDLIYNQENSEKLKNNMDKERITYESAKSMPIKSQADLEKLHRGQQIIENEIKQIDETIQGLLPEIQKKTAQLQTEKEQKDKVLLEKAKFLSETEIKVNTAKNSLDALVSKRDYLTSEIQKNKKNLADSEKMIDQQKSQYNDALNESPSLKNELNQASSRLKTLKDQESKIMTNLSEKRSLLEQLRFNESSLKNKSKIISELLKQKELGNICGIFGRLGDLATIDPKYDCAASSCCGYLDHCLVDTMDTAVKCVEFLRSSSLGVGSFIALDKMNDHKDACKSHFSGPPASVRVFDLLNPLESCFLPALYFAFRDTLVADNIDEATRTAFGKTRYRVVTLKGDIVEKNGTITTGGEPIRGRIRLSSASHSLDRSHSHIKPEDLTKEIDVLSNKQTELLQETIELEKKISSLSAKIEQLDVIIEKTPKQIRILEQECKSMVSVRSKLEKEYETCLPDQDELHKVQMNLEQQKKEKEKAQSNYDVVEQQIKKINQQIAVIRGNILDCHQTELNSKKRLLEDIHKELSKTSASVSANERALQKSESALIELKNNLEIASKKVHKLEEEYELSESELSSHRDSLLKMEEQNCGSSQLIKELQRQIKDLEQQHEACRRKMLDIKLKGDEIMSQVKAYEAKVQHIQHQIQKLVIRSFNNEGEEIVVSVPPPSDSEISDSNRNKINVNHTKNSIKDQIKETQHYINSCKPDLNAIVQYLKQVGLIRLTRINFTLND